MSGIEIFIFCVIRAVVVLFLAELGWFLVQCWDWSLWGFVWLFAGAGCLLRAIYHAKLVFHVDEWVADLESGSGPQF